MPSLLSKTLPPCKEPTVNRSSGHPPVVQSYGLTDAGRIRPSNEDHFLIAELARTMWVRHTSLPQPETQFGDHRAHVFLVADGMGGHNAGEVASALTVETFENFMLNMLHRFSNLRPAEEAEVAREFREALEKAHDRIFEESATHPEFSGMGTTLTLAFLTDWTMFVVHAGDSRCYLLRHGKMKQLTSDHTVVAELLRRGVMRPEDAPHCIYRHMVTNVVGGTVPQIRADIHQVHLRPGDVILLCTDGLTNMCSDERIAEILLEERHPEPACERLIEEANGQGGKDNITALVASLADVENAF